ncbi:hypothetical protein UCDDS831_g05875 [Diplodia seriata]|uniref:Uncharacterized protein n=1 Tax=Diplodia seriata TaxID=420778 RepID=A0A0G2GP28_9PEZI|nr:hypothetical protein UCDDS831_g05875 [Diplodia seriata]
MSDTLHFIFTTLLLLSCFRPFFHHTTTTFPPLTPASPPQAILDEAILLFMLDTNFKALAVYFYFCCIPANNNNRIPPVDCYLTAALRDPLTYRYVYSLALCGVGCLLVLLRARDDVEVLKCMFPGVGWAVPCREG